MLFNSTSFIFAFLPIVLAGWWGIRNEHLRLIWLTLSSYVFYVLFDFPTGLKLLPLLLISTIVDYTAGIMIHRETRQHVRRRWMLLSVTLNLSILGFFKYLGFFEQILDGIAGAFGRPDTVPIHHIILPLGISFYTFNSMSYTIDIYRGVVSPARSIVHYSAFVALFPHLIAGPIVRFRDMDIQLRSVPRHLSAAMAFTGIAFFSVGLFKKLVVADWLFAERVDTLYANSAELGVISGIVAILGYSVQLFFDFSAYSEMAVGLAMLLGLRYPQNFNSPFKAVSMADFWRRWHMTLGHWIRDYLFIPLGGSRGPAWFVARNSFITMFLVGIWHGAAWTYVCFGLGHGIVMAGHVLLRKAGYRPFSLVTSRLTTLAIWTSLAVFIKAPTMEMALNVLTAAVGRNGIGLDHVLRPDLHAVGVPIGFIALLAAILVALNTLPNIYEMLSRPVRLPRMRATAVGVAGGSGILLMQAPSPFLYFQF